MGKEMWVIGTDLQLIWQVLMLSSEYIYSVARVLYVFQNTAYVWSEFSVECTSVLAEARLTFCRSH